MPKSESGRELPEHYKKPIAEPQEFAEEDYKFRYRLLPNGQVEYTVYDGYEHKHETYSCTLHQFEMGLAAMVDDGQLTGAEYEDAERSQGSSIRWIP